LREFDGQEFIACAGASAFVAPLCASAASASVAPLAAFSLAAAPSLVVPQLYL